MTDAVVIGAGVNGLVAAARLAEAGWRVHVVEQAAEPGGAVKTRPMTLPGFRHDWGAMNLSLFAGSGFARRYGARLAGHGLAFVPAKDCFATAFPDGRWLGVSTDINLTAARLNGAHPGDGEAWRRMAAEFPAKAGPLLALLGGPATSGSLVRRAWETWRGAGTEGLGELGRLLLASPREFLDDHFGGARTKAMLAAWGMHLDFPPDMAGGAVFPYLEGMANQAFGMVLGRGGAETLTRALVGMIEARGGTVECGARVTRVLTSGLGARGVELADGRRILAPRAVIANVAPGALAELVPDLPEGTFERGIRRFRHAPGTMMVHLALDGLPDWAAGRELQRFAYVHLAPSLGHMAAAYTEAVAGLLPQAPVLVVGQPTAVDPSRAPAGKHILWVQVRMVPGEILGDAAGQIGARSWAEAEGPMTERVLDILESYAPGLRGRILGRAVVTPEGLAAENPNLVGGDQITGSHHLRQNFLFRPVAGYSDGRTPVRRLHLTGAGVWPGGGVGAGSGAMLGDRLARRW